MTDEAYERGFQDGLSHSSQNNNAYELGLNHGSQLAQKIGFYWGFCSILKTSNLSERKLGIVNSFFIKVSDFSSNLDLENIDSKLLFLDSEFKKIQSFFPIKSVTDQDISW